MLVKYKIVKDALSFHFPTNDVFTLISAYQYIKFVKCFPLAFTKLVLVREMPIGNGCYFTQNTPISIFPHREEAQNSS